MLYTYCKYLTYAIYHWLEYWNMVKYGHLKWLLKKYIAMFGLNRYVIVHAVWKDIRKSWNNYTGYLLQIKITKCWNDMFSLPNSGQIHHCWQTLECTYWIYCQNGITNMQKNFRKNRNVERMTFCNIIVHDLRWIILKVQWLYFFKNIKTT